MPIIDVDAHAELALDWLDEFPSLKARFPDLLPDTDPRFRLGTAEMFAYFVSDDVLRQVPPEDRMPIDRIHKAEEIPGTSGKTRHCIRF